MDIEQGGFDTKSSSSITIHICCLVNTMMTLVLEALLLSMHARYFLIASYSKTQPFDAVIILI